MFWGSFEDILSSYFIGARKKSHSINAEVESGAGPRNLILTKQHNTIQGTQYSFLALQYREKHLLDSVFMFGRLKQF